MMTVSWMRTPRVLAFFVLLALGLALSPGIAGADAWQSSRNVSPGQLLPPGQVPVGSDDGDVTGDPDSGPLLPPGQVPGGGDEGGNPAPNTPPDVTSPIQDSDGDGIPNAQDPDDDNGGVADDQDEDPFDPDVEPPPPSDPLSPIHDDDGDGIPNIQDPDDNNNGISDDEDPGETAVVPPATGGDSSGGSAVRGPAGSGSGASPVVLRLPTTGSGMEEGISGAVWSMVAGAMATVGLCALAMRKRER